MLMKQLFIVVVFSFLSITSLPIFSAEPADEISQPGNEPYTGDNLCPPAAYLQDPGDCLPYGPSATLSNLAQEGIVYPFLPLVGTKPDFNLTEMPVDIARVNVPPPDQAPIYSSLEDASTGNNPIQVIPAGQLLYISYVQWVDVDNNHYLLRGSGGWMRASPLSGVSTFQGLIFNSQPYTSFGWIVEMTKPKAQPSFNAPDLNIDLPREKVVPIYSVLDVDGNKWYMIGLNEWVERRYIRQLVVNTTPPQGVTNNRWIEINLYEQTMSVYENNKLIFASLIATGVDPYFTRPGLFQIYEKKPLETMSGAFAADHSDYYYLEDVPWTMYFDESRALHGAYWRAWFGYEQSHGCVNLSVGDSHWLYDWANVGDWVYVWDPSGETPTDPAYYGNGGA
jgi:hypothetical protein